MKAVKATYENGHVTLAEAAPLSGPIEVLVVFPDTANDEWDKILAGPTPRQELSRWVSEIEQGKSSPLKVIDCRIAHK